LQQATDFCTNNLYFSILHLYLQKMLAIILKEFKVQPLRYVELNFCQNYYVLVKNFSLQLQSKLVEKISFSLPLWCLFNCLFRTHRYFCEKKTCFCQSLLTLLLLILLPLIYVFILCALILQWRLSDWQS